ncbi:nuclear transport factor 2 family protein [Pseudonocardia sp. C8]|uniref:ester cyclase n=1 Tax=Pseudonocardia sp. C8 TaxID=2762759 RepID=UPI0016425FFD|nr:nuclear transport factor 2 family protein [Pseudonocardia sp. C8]MBC3192909.1 nuclear transport factor 2 family protein [Pseudonocardia sp. C8]
MTDTIPAVSSAPLQLAQAYFDAWNAHDGIAVVGTFAPAGTYLDPTLPGPIGGDHLAGYVGGLVAAFPDLRFALEDVAVDGDRVIGRWRMQGTNTGPLPGAPEPTGGTCDLPGVDVITVGEGGITSVVGYFDQKTFVEQLGLQALVVPADEPPMTWGYSVRTDLGNPTVPGALSMTWTDVGSDAEQEEVQIRSRQIVQEVAAEPGFIAWLGTASGRRMHTVTAWTSPEAAASAMARSAGHREAVARVRRDGLLPRGFTSIWVPHRLNQQQTDCPACGTKVWFDPGAAPRCDCGAELTVGSYL